MASTARRTNELAPLRAPLIGGDTRTLLDVGVYVLTQVLLLWGLCAARIIGAFLLLPLPWASPA